MVTEALSVYKDTYRFFRKNLYVSFMFFGINILYFYFQLLAPNDKSLHFLKLITSSLLAILIATYMIVVVYKKVGVYDSALPVSSAIKKYYWKTALIFLFGGITFVISIIPFLYIFLSVASLPLSRLHVFIFQLVVVLICGPVFLGLLVLAPRWLMLYDGGVLNAIKLGFRELFKNFPFYFFVSLVGVGVAASLLFLLYLGDNYNWIRAFLSSLSTTWMSVMYTFAFLHSLEKFQGFETSENSTLNRKS